MNEIKKFKTVEGYCEIINNELTTTRGDILIPEEELKKVSKKVILFQSIYPLTFIILGIRKIFQEEYEIGIIFIIVSLIFGYTTINLIRETNKSIIKLSDIKEINIKKPFLGFTLEKIIIKFNENHKTSRKTLKLPEKELENSEKAKEILKNII
ncbi:hypothetical protein QVZ41_13740 [Wenyingzhuangia sp. chi5]|uniref:Uncharacterized protein n=1 Tax=Wenyingzhuangia gilva TaxID=3057677 RepID=A0ABT8VVA7_9FLAO|nr:hypothetical protein [Wenyingzhuangia sp. chi5]MDO3695908.1 hypothetical protein [Wenyingzhuangia sp. chi5]